MEDLKYNLQKTHERINEVCIRSGRKSSDVKMLLATKTIQPKTILEVFSYGELLIGENRVQELLEKYDALKSINHKTHFIGHLQSNKIKSIIDKVSCIESVDNIRLAQKINSRLVANDLTMDILVEVNTSGESSKIGCKPDELLDLLTEISTLPAIRVKGLMTIGALTDDKKKVRACFTLLRKLAEKAKSQNIANIKMDELSMGMSGDFEIAIEEGSTEVRLGSVIFGSRPKK